MLLDLLQKTPMSVMNFTGCTDCCPAPSVCSGAQCPAGPNISLNWQMPYVFTTELLNTFTNTNNCDSCTANNGTFPLQGISNAMQWACNPWFLRYLPGNPAGFVEGSFQLSGACGIAYYCPCHLFLQNYTVGSTVTFVLGSGPALCGGAPETITLTAGATTCKVTGCPPCFGGAFPANYKFTPAAGSITNAGCIAVNCCPAWTQAISMPIVISSGGGPCNPGCCWGASPISGTSNCCQTSGVLTAQLFYNNCYDSMDLLLVTPSAFGVTRYQNALYRLPFSQWSCAGSNNVMLVSVSGDLMCNNYPEMITLIPA